MGITIGDAILWIKGDASQLDQDFQKVEGKTRSWTSGVGDVIKLGLGTAMGFLTAQAIPGIINGLGSFVTEAAAAEETQAQLEAVLKSTGGVAGMTADSVNDLATSLSEVTRFEDDAIVAGENMLLTFTNIGKDVFPGATETMLDMSQALGQDMKSSAIQLGKALNDPITGVTALQRVGVSFTDAQKDQIAAMVESGDVMGAQKLILAELNKEFGGSAKAAGQTFSGMMDRLKNSVGNVKESIGEQLIPVLTDFVSGSVLPFVQEYGPKLAEWLGTNLPIAAAALSDFWTTTLQPALIVVWAWMQGSLFPALATLFAWLGEHLPPAIQALAAFWTNTLQPALAAVWAWMQGSLFPALATLWAWLSTNLPPVIQALANFWTNVLWPAIQAVWEWMSGTLFPFLSALGDVFVAVIGKNIEILAGIWENILKPALVAMWSYFSDNILPILQTVANWIRQHVSPAFNGLGKAVEGVIGWLRDLAQRINNLKLPDWLTPGSPTPFELGLRGISNAMGELAGSKLPDLQSALQIGLQPALATAGVGSGGGVIVNIGTINAPGGPAEVRKATEDGVMAASRRMGLR